MLEAYAASAGLGVSLVVKGGSWSLQGALAIGLASLLALPPHAVAQQPTVFDPAAPPQAPAAAPAPLPVKSLKILVLQGQGATNDIRLGITSSPVVEVRDDNSLPVSGADVVFELPKTGPGGAFAGQQSTATAKTRDSGQATVTFMPNNQTGRFNIKVTATIGNRIGHALITQTNATHAARPERTGLFKFAWWKVAVVAGAGVAIGFLVARRGGSGPSVTLIPGTPTFGAP